jgi:hypothetical protein
MGTKKTVRRINPTKQSARESKKKAASEGVVNAKKKIDDATKRRADRTAKRNELKERLEAASEEEKVQINEELKKLEEDIVMDNTEISQAKQDVSNYQQQEKEAEAEDVTEDMEVDDEDNPNNYKTNTEGSGASGSTTSANPKPPTGGSGTSESSTSTKDLVDAFLSGAAPKAGLWAPLDLTYGAGLLPTQRVVAFKSSGQFGQIGMVIDTEIPRCPIFRIRKNVIVPKGVLNIMDLRRAGKTDPDTDLKWTVDDIDEVVGIAIAVPPGYEGNVEDLAKAIPKLSLQQKADLKKAGQPIPRQPEVQLIIKWQKPIKIKVKGEPEVRQVYLSYESRTGCKTLWKKNYELTLESTAEHWERHYREAGGTHQSEEREMTPFQVPPVGAEFSRESTVDTEQLASTRTTPERVLPPIETPVDSGQKPSSGSTPPSNKTDKAAKKEAFDRFKDDYLLGAGVDKWTDLTPEEAATGVAAFRIFWDKELKASAT